MVRPVQGHILPSIPGRGILHFGLGHGHVPAGQPSPGVGLPGMLPTLRPLSLWLLSCALMCVGPPPCARGLLCVPRGVPHQALQGERSRSGSGPGAELEFWRPVVLRVFEHVPVQCLMIAQHLECVLISSTVSARYAFYKPCLLLRPPRGESLGLDSLSPSQARVLSPPDDACRARETIHATIPATSPAAQSSYRW